MPGCRVVFSNELPAYYNVTIVGIGARFFYLGGREYVAQRQVSLNSGQSDHIDTDTPNECVGAVVGVVAVIQNGAGKTLTKTVTSPPNECTTDVKFALCPAPSMEPAKFKTEKEGVDFVQKLLESNGFVLENASSNSAPK